jgi:flagellar assembly protein FliH
MIEGVGGVPRARVSLQDGTTAFSIVPDESLAAGDAVATCNATTIDARLSAAIERVRQVLAP